MSLLQSKYFLLDQWYFGAQQGEVKVNRDPLLKIYNDSGSDFYTWKGNRKDYVLSSPEVLM